MNTEACYCCRNGLHAFAESPMCEAQRCEGCGSLLTKFSSTADQKDPWEMGSVTPSFLEALKLRRAIQARQIVNHFGPQLRAGKALDYGCGQGAFVSYMRQCGIDAVACDISDTYLEGNLRDSFIELTGPWAVPDLSGINTICFLDVLEHSPDPGALIGQLHKAGVNGVLVKVPMLHGPIGRASQILARLGRPGLLYRLLLVDEISPHYSFFTSKGLTQLFASNGFRLADSVSLADVGSELPERLRGKEGEPSKGGKRAIFTAFGALLSLVSPIWSDTRVFLFQRQ
jgi:SAM-dependent methyltransferase